MTVTVERICKSNSQHLEVVSSMKILKYRKSSYSRIIHNLIAIVIDKISYKK